MTQLSILKVLGKLATFPQVLDHPTGKEAIDHALSDSALVRVHGLVLPLDYPIDCHRIALVSENLRGSTIQADRREGLFRAIAARRLGNAPNDHQ